MSRPTLEEMVEACDVAIDALQGHGVIRRTIGLVEVRNELQRQARDRAADGGGVIADNDLVDRVIESLERDAFDSRGGLAYLKNAANIIRNLRASLNDTRPAAEAVGVWQPIESAPKDGSYVLAANAAGAWIAKWHPVYPSGYRPDSPWASMMLNHEHIPLPGRFNPPTHWMPLPAAPSQPEGVSP